MNSFTTFNQFDKRFSDFEKFNNNKTACPLFSLITSYNFMQNGDISQKKHENNIIASITNYTIKDFPKYMSFDELLDLSNGTLNSSNIGATTPELITSGILGYDNIFKFGNNKNYSIIFLKNRNYIIILVKYLFDNEILKGEIYSVRDCHENTQRNFDNFESLRDFLNKIYQFEQITCVDGVMIPEFSNIEYLVIDIPFNLVNIDVGLIDEIIEIDNSYFENEKKKENINDINMKLNIDQEMAYALQLADADNEYLEYI